MALVQPVHTGRDVNKLGYMLAGLFRGNADLFECEDFRLEVVPEVFVQALEIKEQELRYNDFSPRALATCVRSIVEGALAPHIKRMRFGREGSPVLYIDVNGTIATKIAARIHEIAHPDELQYICLNQNLEQWSEWSYTGEAGEIQVRAPRDTSRVRAWWD